MKKLLLIILLFIPIIGFSQLAQPDTVITDVPDEIMKSVKVYPNPFIESLTVDGSDEQVDFYSVAGVKLATFSNNLSTTTFPRGVYFVVTRKKGFRIIKKLVKY